MIATKIKGSLKGARVARPRHEVENAKDPRGQFGAYLRHWIDKHHGGDSARLASSLNVSLRTIQTWGKGQAGPSFGDLDRVAVAMDFDDWSKLAAAVVRFSK